MKLRRPWTEQDDQALAQALADGVSMQRMVIRLKRHESTIRARAKVLSLVKTTLKRPVAQEP